MEGVLEGKIKISKKNHLKPKYGEDSRQSDAVIIGFAV